MVKPLSSIIPDHTSPSASLSRPFDNAGRSPKLFHTLHQEQNSVLSLAADASHVYSGSPTGDISVWDKHMLKLKTSLRGHTGSVLTLEYTSDKEWLFSASGEHCVTIWSTRFLCSLYILNPHGETDAGDLFSLAWSPALQTLYWFTFSISPFPSSSLFAYGSIFLDSPDASGCSTLTRHVHKFFESYPQYQRRLADLFTCNPTCLSCSNGSPPLTPPLTSSSLPSTSGSPSSSTQALQHSMITLQVPPANVIYSVHYGYIYCMTLVPSSPEADGEMHNLQLVTRSGDETVKLWQLASGNSTPILLHTFGCCTGAVLTVTVCGETVFAGCQDGHVQSLLHSDLSVCFANGELQRWSSQFDCTASWKAHEGIVLSSIVMSIPSSPFADADLHELDMTACFSPAVFALVTGANHQSIDCQIWEVEPPKLKLLSPLSLTFDIDLGDASNETMVYVLSKLVSIPSVSNSLAHQKDCRQAAIWLCKCFTQLGAVSSLLPTGESTNPLVFATFSGMQTKRKHLRILFYGHYGSDPFALTGCNGYLYGRGATDNKGPIMAVVCVAAELLIRCVLDLDLVLLIEGEEEAGSGGFTETVWKNKDAIGPIDAILVSNLTWIVEDTPCITYGLCRVVHCHISCKGPDRHSSVDGGATIEPMLDMLKPLGTLIDRQNRITIPKFYKSVHPIMREEEHLYLVLAGIMHMPASSIAARWHELSLTVHNVEVSGPRNSTVIPATVKAHVSLHIVPDQDLNTVTNALCEHLQWSFEKMHSPNKLKEPLQIREGGFIPSLPYLEREFTCHVLHLPMGKSSLIVECFLQNVAKLEPSHPSVMTPEDQDGSS
ncbi:uncharacterized protein LAESUDRAFT_732836 [Laetiporus sulphureus 93-53]|uniref:Uncharacterized protein n=1 Tax=Laetiporus sulphureus 93-53 TaxID=1314785 RepID=A0A165AXE1_9APHY|nr:uncharacterized protein LAESUDRAFT_732836 [Laetiporus sulphureus 93-53]KZS99837.1 hypothetical protein LAESUDRAFT_732836 [Laetiporus sulphureus 93-53]